MPLSPTVTSEIPRYGTHRSVLGLPARAVALTNSERGDAACDLRWYFGHGLGLRSVKASVPLSFGAAGHDAMQDLWGWWAATDRAYDPQWFETCAWCSLGVGQQAGEPCPACGGSGEGPVPRSIRAWEAQRAAAIEVYGAEDEDKEDIPRRAERLRRVLDGYLRTYGKSPPGDLRVVAVEIPIARAILGPGGKPYAPEVYLFRETDGSCRFARHGDDPDRVFVEKIPWHFVGICDVVVASRNTGALFVGEHKFSKAPETFFSGLTNDPQTTAYCWALDAVKGLLPVPRDLRDGAGIERFERVAGYLYMVNASSYQHDPEVLKDGGLSKARSRTVPSWRFQRFLQAENVRQRGNVRLDPALYAEHVAWLKSAIDPKLYRREHGTVGPIERERFGQEVYAVAARHARMRRDAYRSSTVEEVVRAFPRTPVCRQPGGFCAFRGPCASATFRPSFGPGTSFVVAPGQRWLPEQLHLPTSPTPTVTTDPVNEPASGQEENEPCPF